MGEWKPDKHIQLDDSDMAPDKTTPGTLSGSEVSRIGEQKKPPRYYQELDLPDLDLGGLGLEPYVGLTTHHIYYWVIPANVQGDWQWKSDGKRFSMSVNQTFQKIDPEIRAAGQTLEVTRKVLAGDRISLTVVDPDHSISYVFNGRVDENHITGKVQIRNEGRKMIRDWSAGKK